MDNNTIQLPPYSDQTLAKIGFKISNRAIYDNINYENECLNVIFDYAIIYIKSVIRFMARHKRKFKIDCHMLTRKDEKIEKNSRKDESLNNNNEKLMPWQMKLDWDKIKRENVELLDENELNGGEKERQNKEVFHSKTWKLQSPNHEEGMDVETESRTNVADQVLKPVQKCQSVTSQKDLGVNYSKKLCKEDRDKKMKKKTGEYIINEVIYSHNTFSVRDLLQLLKMNSHVIPVRSAHQVFMMRVLKKLASKPTGVQI